MARLDILLTGYDITDEVINRSSSSSLKLDHDTIRGTADIEIWTGAGGTGTQLALTTDYTVAGEDTRLSTAVGGGILVYTTLAIVNGAYHSTDLYVTYKTIGDYASASTARLIGIGLKEITGDYTVNASDRTIIVNTSSAVTITIPDGLYIGSEIFISRSVASTNAVTVAMSGSETIEGGSSFITHIAYDVSGLDYYEAKIKKVSSTEFRVITQPKILISYALASSSAITTGILKYDTKNVDLYGNYNTSTGILTIPYKCKYLFTVSHEITGTYLQLQMRNNTTILRRPHNLTFGNVFSCILDLDAGYEINFYANNTGGTPNGGVAANYFDVSSIN